MRRWNRWATMGLGLTLFCPSLASAAPRTGPGGWCSGPRLRAPRRSGADLRLGYGSRFGARGYYSPYWSMPGYGWGGFPGYAGFSGFGYGPTFADLGYGFGSPFPPFAFSPTQAYLPYWNNAVGVNRYSLPWNASVNSVPNTIELPPRVVVIGGGESYAPRLTDGGARPERDGERYYLDPRGPAPVRERPSTLKDTLRESIRIETADTDQYLVRWTGDPSELAALELTALDADRKVVMRRLIKAAPFRGLLNTGGKTTMVTVSFDLKDGPTVTLEYSLERLQALTND